MASSIFIDTNGWLAILNSDDRMHAQADRKWSEVVLGQRHVVLTDWVVAETGTAWLAL